MRKYYLTTTFLFTCFFIFSQNVKTQIKSLNTYKQKFNERNRIGVDSVLIYMNKLIISNNIPYKTYGYAATEYLKTKEKKKVNQQLFQDSINKYLPQIKVSPENYTILFDTYILLGNTNKRREKPEQALRYYLKAETIANKAKDIVRIVKIQSNIGLIYQDIGALNKSVSQLKKTLDFLENHKNKLSEKYYQRRFKTLSNLGNVYNTFYQEKGGNEVYLDSSLHCFHSILEDKKFELSPYKKATIDLCLGSTYSLQKKYTKAIGFFEKALVYFKKEKTQADLYKIYYNLGVSYFNSENYDKAKENLFQIFKINKSGAPDTNLANAYYYICEMHMEEGHIDSAHYYLKKYKKSYSIVSKNEELQQKTTTNLIQLNDLEKRVTKLYNKNQYYSAIISFLILLLALSVFLIFRYNKEKKKTRQRLEELLLSATDKNKIEENNTNINDEQHQEIIKGLHKIETNLYFLKEEFNLYNAAKKIGTNTTYLSKVIKTYKKMNFSEYTNHLRINHIVKILSTDKKVRAYTTQAIGEIGGYKNAKSFTRIFKKHTGITPYQFIEKIDTEV